MINHPTVGTNDLKKASAFFDELFKLFDAGRVFEMEGRGIFYGQKKIDFAVMKPFDGKPATVGNGCMVTLAAKSREHAQQIHAKALSLGATNEGDPGLRSEQPPIYAAYFRDLDGNKFCALYMG